MDDDQNCLNLDNDVHFSPEDEGYYESNINALERDWPGWTLSSHTPEHWVSPPSSSDGGPPTSDGSTVTFTPPYRSYTPQEAAQAMKSRRPPRTQESRKELSAALKRSFCSVPATKPLPESAEKLMQPAALQLPGRSEHASHQQEKKGKAKKAPPPPLSLPVSIVLTDEMRSKLAQMTTKPTKQPPSRKTRPAETYTPTAAGHRVLEPTPPAPEVATSPGASASMIPRGLLPLPRAPRHEETYTPTATGNRMTAADRRAAVEFLTSRAYNLAPRTSSPNVSSLPPASLPPTPKGPAESKRAAYEKTAKLTGRSTKPSIVSQVIWPAPSTPASQRPSHDDLLNAVHQRLPQPPRSTITAPAASPPYSLSPSSPGYSDSPEGPASPSPSEQSLSNFTEAELEVYNYILEETDEPSAEELERQAEIRDWQR